MVDHAAGVGDQTRVSRVALIGDDEAEPEVTAVFDRVRAEAGGVPQVYRALAHAPHVLQAWIGLGWGLRTDSVLDAARGELAVMRVAQLTGCDYVWRSHYRLALRAGVTEAELDALATWRWSTSDRFGDHQRAVLAAVDALAVAAHLPDETWLALREEFSDRERIELVLGISWYCCVARVIAGLALPLEPHHHKVPPVPHLHGSADGDRRR